MARFDVYEFKGKLVPLVIEVQADLLASLDTCVVVPLVPEEAAKEEALPRLKPLIKINEKNYILVTTDIGTVTRKSLGKRISNIEPTHRQDITDALDFLFQGF